MLGPPKRRVADQPVTVTLEGLVPTNHFYRHLDAQLDLSFVRDWVSGRYAERGRPSIDPVVFFKLQLIMFFEGLRSERRLLETASLHLAHRWYLGYGLDEPLPDHSSLTRIRQRLGLAVFERFFEHIVELCQQAGLVWGKELFFDATKVRANADVDSLVPRFYWRAKQHLGELFADAPADEEPVGTERPTPETSAGTVGGRPTALPLPLAPRERVALAAENAARWALLEHRRLDPGRPPSGPYQRLTDFRISTTDPDAAPMKLGGQGALGYQDHYVVDGGKRRIILAALVTPGDVMENVPMLELLRRVRFRWKLRPKRAVGDTAYGTGENLQGLEADGIRAYIPLPDWGKRSPFFNQRDFTYDPEGDIYRCP
jgi:transposase